MNPLPLLPPLGRIAPAQPLQPLNRERDNGADKRKPHRTPHPDARPPPQGEQQQHINDYAQGAG